MALGEKLVLVFFCAGTGFDLAVVSATGWIAASV
jgi:hypothetical protein